MSQDACGTFSWTLTCGQSVIWFWSKSKTRWIKCSFQVWPLLHHMKTSVHLSLNGNVPQQCFYFQQLTVASECQEQGASTGSCWATTWCDLLSFKFWISHQFLSHCIVPQPDQPIMFKWMHVRLCTMFVIITKLMKNESRHSNAECPRCTSMLVSALLNEIVVSLPLSVMWCTNFSAAVSCTFLLENQARGQNQQLHNAH